MQEFYQLPNNGRPAYDTVRIIEYLGPKSEYNVEILDFRYNWICVFKSKSHEKALEYYVKLVHS